MKDAGREIELNKHLIIHFPEWYISLSDAAQVPYYKYSLSLFVDFMTEYESIQNRKCEEETRKAASAKHLALSRYLLSFYTEGHEQGS